MAAASALTLTDPFACGMIGTGLVAPLLSPARVSPTAGSNELM